MGLREAKAKAAREFLGQPGVVAVYIGKKISRGLPTGQTAVVFGVEKKLTPEQCRALGRKLLPTAVEGEVTDVIEVGKIVARSLTAKQRPCPGGFSIGHVAITAGTLGAWVKRGASDLWHVLSNNHVLANSNDAAPGDTVLQPGGYDGGTTTDQLARLTEFAQIRFEGQDGGQKKKNNQVLWTVAKALPNFIARLARCPYRLVVGRPFAVGQPYPNLVDAALALPLSQADVALRIEQFGPVNGIRDLAVGDAVTKVGRTTERTTGQVAGVEASVIVEYGPDRQARFDDQVLIEPGGFSTGGDSGSVILTPDGFIGGLLFAGSETVTIANKISNVVAILGVRL